MSKVSTNQAVLALALIRSAEARGTKLSYKRAKAAVRGAAILKGRGFRLTVNSLRDMPSTLRPAARWVCAVLHDARGIDPEQYLAEFDRLDAADALDAVARWRSNRMPTIHPGRPAVLCERAWIEANGY